MQIIRDALAPKALEEFKRLMEGGNEQTEADLRIERLREKRAKDAEKAEEMEDRARVERKLAARLAAAVEQRQ